MRRIQCLLYRNDCYVAGKKITPTKIVLHSTGVNNPTLKRYVQPHAYQITGMEEYEPTRKTYSKDEMVKLLGKNPNGNDWNRSGIGACVHGFIGKLADGSIATVQTLPWNMRCWGCASGRNGSYNNNAIQFEICEDSHASADYCKRTFEEAAQLCAHLIRSYPTIKSVNDIVSHYEAGKLGYGSSHVDPTNWWPKHGLTMDKFRARVKKLLESGEDTTEQPTQPEQPAQPSKPDDDDNRIYRIRKAWADTKSQTGAFKNLENAKNACAIGYTVYDWNGKAVYTRKGKSTEMARSFSSSKAGAYMVNASGGLRLRYGAGTDKTVIETMPNGSMARCYGYYTGEWLYVVSESGATGFAHSDYLRKK